MLYPGRETKFSKICGVIRIELLITDIKIQLQKTAPTYSYTSKTSDLGRNPIPSNLSLQTLRLLALR